MGGSSCFHLGTGISSNYSNITIWEWICFQNNCWVFLHKLLNCIFQTNYGTVLNLNLITRKKNIMLKTRGKMKIYVNIILPNAQRGFYQELALLCHLFIILLLHWMRLQMQFSFQCVFWFYRKWIKGYTVYEERKN